MTPSRWTYFSTEELTCHCGCGQMLMDGEFMLKLVALRDLVGVPMPISSGYRCPSHNAAVSHTGDDGPHTTGKAVDIQIARDRATSLVRAALDVGFHGVGIKQHGPDSGRIVHLDMVDRPGQILWTYP